MNRIDVSGISHAYITHALPQRCGFSHTSHGGINHATDSPRTASLQHLLVPWSICTIPSQSHLISHTKVLCSRYVQIFLSHPPPGIIHVIVFTNRRVTWHRTPFITPSPSHAALVSPCSCMSSALSAWIASNWTHCLTSNSI